jgi:O-antigen ligase
VVLAAWTLFAFAGAHTWTTAPLIAGAVLLAAYERPPILTTPHRLVDGALVVCLTLAAFTVVPLPVRARLALSPGSAAIDRALYLDAPPDAMTGRARPLSVDPAATAGALVLGASFLLLFWSARAIVTRHGLRETARGVAWIGLALSAITLLQHATAPRLLYWYWHPLDSHSTPFGPFVSRNSLATWLIMAVPTTIGYGVARYQSRHHDGRPFDLESTFDATALWLAASTCLMLATTMVALSRSGLTGMVAGLACLMWLARRRIARSGWTWLAAILLTLLAVAATYANWGALADRVGETLALGLAGRREIWRHTWRMIVDFPIAGVGAGAFERAMSVYQPVPHVFFINHAHNQYLQLLAEGGLMLAVPAAIAVGVAAWSIWRRLRADRTPVYWIRAGAASGLVALAVQSTWEVGLILPANAVLFAILAAVALHEGALQRPTTRRGSHSPKRAPDPNDAGQQAVVQAALGDLSV